MIETHQLTEGANFGATAIALLLCVVALVYLLVPKGKRHSPPIQQYDSREALNIAAKVARAYFEENR